jgi:flagellar biosynthesis/type III secretory pathway protein FliH
VAEKFVALATLVRAGRVVESAIMPSTQSAPQTMVSEPPSTHVVRNVRDFAHADIVHELALMRLAAREAFERAVVELLESLARDVLARELTLAPAEIGALVERALGAFAASEPVGISVARVDLQRVHAAVPVRVDDDLQAGDLVVDVRDGALVSSFAFRLDDALARVAAAVRV